MVCNSLECRSIEHLNALLANPDVMVPTFEFRLRTIDLPLDAQDVSYLSDKIKVFSEETSVVDTLASNVRGRMQTSSNLQQPEFQLPTDFLALGVCALIYVEPSAFRVDGTWYSPYSDVIQLTSNPLSPNPLYSDANAFLHSQNRVGGNLLTMCQCSYEHGSPAWKFAEWFLKSYRMVVGCQISKDTHEIMNQRLIDLGNCCSDVTKTGFGNSRASWEDKVRLLNERLAAIQTTNGLRTNTMYGEAGIDSPTDMGQFEPLNCTMTHVPGSATDPFVVTPLHSTAITAEQSFGGPQAEGQSTHVWYKFDAPRLIKAHRNIKINLERRDEDGDFANFVRMIREGAMHVCGHMIPGIDGHSGDIVVGTSSTTTTAASNRMRIPGGRVQIGIGLKGLMLDNSLCSTIESLSDAATGALNTLVDANLWRGGPSTSPMGMIRSGGLQGAPGCEACGA